MSMDEFKLGLLKLNPNAMFYEPQEIFNQALVGMMCDPPDRWAQGRTPEVWVPVYSASLATKAMALANAKEDGIQEGTEAFFDLECEAREHIEYNSMGGWYGENTPTWVEDFDLDNRADPADVEDS